MMRPMDAGSTQDWMIALGAMLGPAIAGLSAFVSYGNQRRAARIAANVEQVKQQVGVVENKMDGPLAALIESIKANAAADIAAAEARTSRRISDAYAAGQNDPTAAAIRSARESPPSNG